MRRTDNIEIYEEVIKAGFMAKNEEEYSRMLGLAKIRHAKGIDIRATEWKEIAANPKSIPNNFFPFKKCTNINRKKTIEIDCRIPEKENK